MFTATVERYKNKCRQEGRQEGRLEGKLEGKKEGKLETARELLKMGMTIEVIAKATGLPAEEIKALQ